MSSDTASTGAVTEPVTAAAALVAADPAAAMVSGALSNVMSDTAPAPHPAPEPEASAELPQPPAAEQPPAAVAAPAEQAPEGSASAEGSAHAEETNQTETPKEDVVADVKSHDAAAEPAASAAAVAETPPDPVGDTHPVAAYDPVAALVGGALEKATADVATAQPVAPVEETAPTALEEPVVAATAPPPTTPPFDPVAALVGGALLKAGAKGVPSAETTTSVGEPTPEVVGEPARPAATPTPTSPPEEKERKKSSGGFFGRLWNGGGSKDLKIEDGSGAIGAAADPVAPIDDTVGAFALGNAKDGFGSPVATSGPGSPVEVGSPEGEREEEGGEGTQAGTVVYTAAPSATEATAVPEAPEATAVPAVPEVAPAAAGEAQPVAEVPVPATPASASANGVVAFPAAAPASNPDPTTSSPPPPARAMSPAEIAKSANVLELLQARMASPEKPMAPRLLSRADALSVCVHASSALVPDSSIVSPVVRMHLVDPEMGAPVRPSGEASTPIQTAPFDLSARRNATFAAEWEETLEVEEALGDIMAVGAIVLFEVLQPPPSFQYFEERAASFPGGQPMRLAWGFLKLLRGADGKPNMGRLKVQLYKWEDRPAQAGVMGAVAAVVGGGGVSGVSAAPNAPDVFRVWKKASILTPALRHLYPAHLNVTIGSSPRGDVVAALLSAARPGVETPRLAIAPPPVPRMASLSGLGDDENSAFTQRPSRRERIDRERALGGGWRNAQARLQRAPQGDQSEIVTRLGRLPHETLCYGMDPVSAVAAAAAQAVADAETATPGLSGSTSWKTLPGMKRTIVRLPHARSKQEACLLPNTDARTQPHLPTSTTEATLVCFDPMGRRVAVVTREGGMYVVRVFDTTSGVALVTFPGHASCVYDVAWAPQGVKDGAGDALGTVDFAAPATRVVTASADGACVAWRVPGMGADSSASYASASSLDIVVAQHACEVYAAAWHPALNGVLATGARDGAVRLWLVEDGVAGAQLLAAVASAPGTAATAMGFDHTGMRLWVGFADGVLREHRVEGTNGAGASVRPTRECQDLLGEPITCLRVSPTDRRVFARTTADRIAAIDVSFFAATHTFDVSVGRGSTMRRLRGDSVGVGAQSLGGAGRSLAGTGDGAFASAGASGAASAGRPLARFAVSPDGRWLLAGTADGTARLFDVDVKGVGVVLAAASVPPGVRVNDMDWSPGAHCVAICAAHGTRPVRLMANTEHAPQVDPPPRPQRLLELSAPDTGAGRGGPPSQKARAAMSAARDASGFGPATARERVLLPDKLTPETVRAMLAEVRVRSTEDRQATLDYVQRSRRASPHGTPGRGASPGGGGVSTATVAPVASAAPVAPAARREIAKDWTQKENIQAQAQAPVSVPQQEQVQTQPLNNASFDPYRGSLGPAQDLGKPPPAAFAIAGGAF